MAGVTITPAMLESTLAMKVHSIEESVRLPRRWAMLTVFLLFPLAGSVGAQKRPRAHTGPPVTVRLTRTDVVRLTGDVDSNSPIVWDDSDGVPVLFAITSTAGRPSRANGQRLDALGEPESIELDQ